MASPNDRDNRWIQIDTADGSDPEASTASQDANPSAESSSSSRVRGHGRLRQSSPCEISVWTSPVRRSRNTSNPATTSVAGPSGTQPRFGSSSTAASKAATTSDEIAYSSKVLELQAAIAKAQQENHELKDEIVAQVLLTNEAQEETRNLEYRLEDLEEAFARDMACQSSPRKPHPLTSSSQIFPEVNQLSHQAGPIHIPQLPDPPRFHPAPPHYTHLANPTALASPTRASASASTAGPSTPPSNSVSSEPRTPTRSAGGLKRSPATKRPSAGLVQRRKSSASGGEFNVVRNDYLPDSEEERKRAREKGKGKEKEKEKADASGAEEEVEEGVKQMSPESGGNHGGIEEVKPVSKGKGKEKVTE